MNRYGAVEPARPVIFQGTTDYLNSRAKDVSLAVSSIFVFVWVIVVVIAIISSTYGKRSKWVLGLSWVLVIIGFPTMLLSWMSTDDIRAYFHDKPSANTTPGQGKQKCICPGFPDSYVDTGAECPLCPSPNPAS
jgi:hypothetical protein